MGWNGSNDQFVDILIDKIEEIKKTLIDIVMF